MLEAHPAAAIFPMLEDSEYRGLLEDIRDNGLCQPIITLDGKILDGRNRYKACLELDLEPELQEWEPNGLSAVDYVVSLNLHRRHLTASQKAAIAYELLPTYEAEARQRQLALAGTRPTADPENLSAKMREGVKAAEQAATATHVSPRYVEEVKHIARTAPELVEQIKSGEITVTEAKRQVRKAELANAVPATPTGKYRVIYADPPWKYGSSGMEDYGPAERHYPAMSIQELCELPVREMTEDNAVLFMWVTSPLLAECFAVIKAWGFDYKSSFVWDKVKHNYGHYNSVRHELLLICTRGSCLPDSGKLIDSVVELERSDKHSEKPERFREIIDEMYTHGDRIELFSRAAGTDNWQVWGNECK